MRERRAIRRIQRERAARQRRRRKRALLMTLTLCAAAVISINVFTTAFAGAAEEYGTIVVESGDTLWSIAENCSTGKEDIRAVVNKIMKANNMTTTSICAGTTINVPIR